jgi:hypothetical protein
VVVYGRHAFRGNHTKGVLGIRGDEWLPEQAI